MIRVVLVDDHTIVRKGISQFLEDDFNIEVVGESGDGRSLFRILEETEVDIIILDISLPGKSGIAILKELRNQYPKIKVLVLSMHPEEQYAIRVIKAGAYGYLTKGGSPKEFINAIHKIHKGKKYISPSLAEYMADHIENDYPKPGYEKLSDREFEVMNLLVSGQSISEIAGKMHLSVKTISTYRRRILNKLNLRNNSELIHYAIKNNLA